MSKDTRILITADFCPVNRIKDLIEIGDHKSVFNDFLPVIRDCDLAITNLECPLTTDNEGITKRGPSHKGSPKAAEVLSKAGFKLVTLANNHIMDYGVSGLRNTLDTCERNGIQWVGAGENYESARKAFYLRQGEHTISILNFTENEFSTTQGNTPGANPLDLIGNYHDIRKARESSDFVIVIVHGGHEMYELPSPRIKKTFHFFAEAGASAIIAHHTHCYSGYEIHNGVPIFYGLGNFVFDSPGKKADLWNHGFAIELFLNDPINFKMIPYEQCGQKIGIRLLNDLEKGIFEKNIERLNSIIRDDYLLLTEFSKFCLSVKKMYFSYLEPHSVNLLHYLRNRKLFPSFLTGRKKTLLLNLIRCESHSDILIKLLDRK